LFISYLDFLGPHHWHRLWEMNKKTVHSYSSKAFFMDDKTPTQMVVMLVAMFTSMPMTCQWLCLQLHPRLHPIWLRQWLHSQQCPWLCLWLRPQIFFMVACMCQKLSSRLKDYNNTHKKKFHLLGEHNSSRDRFGLPSAITSLFKWWSWSL
jgi:hypothetical protein